MAAPEMDEDGQLRTLVAKLRTRVSTAESLLTQQGSRVGRLEEYATSLDPWREGVDAALTEIKDAQAKTAPIEWWLIADPDQASKALADVNSWVEAVYLPAGGGLPNCWPLHGQAVTELLSLREMHRRALKARGPADYSNWLRLRRESTDAIRAADSMAKCSITHLMWGDHYEVDAAVLNLGEVARWWVTGRGMDGTVPRGLTLKAEDDR